MIRIEGYDSGEIFEFNGFDELKIFLKEMLGEDFYFMQNLVFSGSEPAYIIR